MEHRVLIAALRYARYEMRAIGIYRDFYHGS
jgi:hypothetical protein